MPGCVRRTSCNRSEWPTCSLPCLVSKVVLGRSVTILIPRMHHLKSLIREVPDFPKPGINFYDITTLLKHAEGLRNTVDALASEFEGQKVDSVIGVEARGFIFAPALAYHIGAGFVPVRKPKKLPAECAAI